MDLIPLIEDFQFKVAEAAAAREAELAARNALFAALLAQELAKKVGATTSTVGQYKVVATGKVNTTLYKASLGEVREKLGDKAFDLAFVSKLEYSASGFKKLTPEQQAIAEDALVVTPGTPTIAISLIEAENAD